MRKKTLCLLLLSLLLCLLIVPASAGTYTLPKNIKTISDYAFYANYDLEEVILPEGVEYIGYQAFGHSSLYSIYLPNTLSYIDDTAFSGCNNLYSVVADSGSYAYDWAVRNGYISEVEEPYIDLSLSDYNLMLNVGDAANLTCTVESNIATFSPSWISSDESVATVEDGLVTAISPGIAYITCSVYGSDLSAAVVCDVTVTDDTNDYPLGEVEFTSHTAFDLYPFYLSDETLTITWSCDNAAYYELKAVTTDEQPQKGVSSDPIIELDYDDNYTKNSYTVYAEDLTDGDYLKFAVHAFDENGVPANYWYWVAFEIIRDDPPVSSVTVELDASEIVIALGESQSVGGTIRAENTKITKATLTVVNYSNSEGTSTYATKSFSGRTSVALEDYFTINTTEAPFNSPGVYYMYVWAADNAGKSYNLACMKITVLSASEYESNQQKIVDRANQYMYSFEQNNKYYAEGIPYYAHGSKVTKYIASGWYLHGVPYSLQSGYCRNTLDDYWAMSLAEKCKISENYYTAGGCRSGVMYGLDCTGFCLDCWNEVQSYSMSGGFSATVKGSAYMLTVTQTDFEAAQPGDVLRSSGHVMLVVSNSPSASELVVIEQTAAANAVVACECAGCSKNEVATLGTRKKTYSYSELSSYKEIYRHKDCMSPTDTNGWNTPGQYEPGSL